MAFKKENLRYLLIGAVVLIILGAQDTLPKRAVADVEGLACITNEDCPCWGKIEGTNIEAFGIGTSTCKEKLCDTSLCIDVSPIGDYARDNPLRWIKDNIVLTLGLIALIISVAYWPKQ